MSRFNAFLVVFAILMVVYLILDGPPIEISEGDDTSTNEDRTVQTDIRGEDIVSIELSRADGSRVSIARQPDGSWQNRITGDILSNSDLPDQIADRIAGLSIRQVTRFESIADLVQYGITSNPPFIVSFETAAVSDDDTIITFSLYVGATTPSNQEYYAVFVDKNTSALQGDKVYAIPSDDILWLDSVVSFYGEQSQQGQGQTPDS